MGSHEAGATARRPGVGAVLRLAVRRFVAQDMQHHASALTYHTVLALFHGVLLGVALLGLVGTGRTVDRMSAFLRSTGADPRVVEGVLTAARGALEAREASAVALVLAVVFALFVCSSAFVAAGTALNVVLEAKDERSLARKRLDAIGHTVVAIVLAVTASAAVFLGGDVAADLFDVVGLGDSAATVWGFVRYPLAAVLATTAYAWMYYTAPRVRGPRWRWITLGAVVGVALWLLASLGLFLFAAYSDSYNATYGAFATAILLIVWLWLTNMTLLLGAEVNAAGRYAEGDAAPMSRTGDAPETAQHEAAKRSGA
jgi:membrane protein